MAYELNKRLVVGLASSALFNLEESDEIYRTKGATAYREFQREHQNKPLEEGVAFPFIRRLLSLNELSPSDHPVEVILLSRNSPDTGMRVMNSLEYYGLGITRSIFLEGKPPYVYIPCLDINLFLSANEADVKQANLASYPAGQVLTSKHFDDPNDHELRIAFDFDGVLADDESETIYQTTGDLDAFREHERKLAETPHNPGPLKDFLEKIAYIQKLEETRASEDSSYKTKIRISIVTARDAPSHKRVINTMRAWGINVNEAFFLGGIEKRKVLEVHNPHIFFDDQKLHLESASEVLPSVHIPFGITNNKVT
ncbi:MAG: 5'-nucleotidase [Pedobacter sp.]